jgi:hypothetical protein
MRGWTALRRPRRLDVRPEEVRRQGPEGHHRTYVRDLAGRQRSKTFQNRRDAMTFLAEIEASESRVSWGPPCSTPLPGGVNGTRNSDAASRA